MSLEELHEPRNTSDATILNNPDISQRCTDLGLGRARYLS